MKQIFTLSLLVCILIGCKKQEPTNYATFSGQVKNSVDSEIQIFNKYYRKKIKLDKDGFFNDTLHVKNSHGLGIIISRQQSPIHIKNGDNLKLNVDANNFSNTLTFSGKGSEENLFLKAQAEYGKIVGLKEKNLFLLEKDEFDLKLKEFEKGLDSINNIYQNLDTTLLNFSKKQNKKVLQFLGYMYASQHDAMTSIEKNIKGLKKGMKSPTFKDYESIEGNKVSLSDFKGKYVFISIWSTGSSQYFQGFKFLKELEEKHKNIIFINLCTENKISSGTWEFAKDKWKRKIKQKGLSGIQLFVGEDKSFTKEYFVFNLPRYILIDPNGKIVDARAPAPNTAELQNLLNTLQ